MVDDAEIRLLILDDDKAMSKTMVAMAQKVTRNVVASSSIDEFFSLLDDWQPTHILLDLIMPDMDGVEVLAKLGERSCPAILILTSGMDGQVLDAARRSAGRHGLNVGGILPKPFSITHFRRLLLQSDAWCQYDVPLVEEKPQSVTEQVIQDGMNRDEFYCVFQPKIECQTGRVAGFEALLRWQRDNGSHITPDRFIPVAEASGQIDALTRTVIRQSLPWYSQWLKTGKQDSGETPLAVNLSARSLQDSALISDIQSLCDDAGVAPENMIFELTETAAMEESVSSLDLLTRLRMRGFRLSIDDFGTGYSTMLKLVSLPFSELKIDRSFVGAVGLSSLMKDATVSMIKLGRKIGVAVTAEGVEDSKTLSFLAAQGCHFAQGFHIARPMKALDLQEWLNARH